MCIQTLLARCLFAKLAGQKWRWHDWQYLLLKFVNLMDDSFWQIFCSIFLMIFLTIFGQLFGLWTLFKAVLTLIGMRGDTFISLSFLDQILSAEFLSKISKLFWRWKLTSIGLIWHSAKLIESYKNMPLGSVKDEHFLLS